MRYTALLVIVLSLTGCCDYDWRAYRDHSQVRENFRSEMRQAREELRDARREFRKDTYEAHRELRDAMRDLRDSWKP